MALWSGRFTEGADAFTQRFGASLPVDQRLYAEDIAGSIAHANMLAAQGIIATADAEAIAEGLQGILADITSGALTFDVMESEDIHMAIEAELTRRVGDAGARLHTGRSRNDQVATDTRLYAKRRAGELMAANVALREALIAQAEANFDVILPGYTHLQHAQPVLFSHHMLAYVQMLARDYESPRRRPRRRRRDARLGAAALGRHHLPARPLRRPRRRSASTIPSRTRSMLCPTATSCSTSSTPVACRACTCRVCARRSCCGRRRSSASSRCRTPTPPVRLSCPRRRIPISRSSSAASRAGSWAIWWPCMMTLKSLPLAYNKDLQEDKEGAMDAADTLEDCYVCAAGMIATMTVNADAMAAQAKKGYLAATDVADYLAKKGLPFRRAHEIVGHLVLLCDQRGCDLEDLTLDDFKAESDLFESDIVECLEPARHRCRPHHLRRHGPRSGARPARRPPRRSWKVLAHSSLSKG